MFAIECLPGAVDTEFEVESVADGFSEHSTRLYILVHERSFHRVLTMGLNGDASHKDLWTSRLGCSGAGGSVVAAGRDREDR